MNNSTNQTKSTTQLTETSKYSITGLANNCLLADSAICFASSTELASTCRVTFLPIRTSDTDRKPRFDNPPSTALPCGYNNSFNGITLICTVYIMIISVYVFKGFLTASKDKMI